MGLLVLGRLSWMNWVLGKPLFIFSEVIYLPMFLRCLFDCSFRITGENKHYGTPANPKLPSFVPGGSSCGSAVAVAGELVDFALG